MINLDWTLFVQAAIFLSFMAYVNFFLLRPMARYLNRRTESIEQMRETGTGQDAELERIQKSYSSKITQARDEMLAQRTAARKEALDIQSSILDEAKKDGSKELLQAEGDLGKEVATARERLGLDARSLAASISEKILGRACQ